MEPHLNRDPHSKATKQYQYQVSYTTRDLLLYALGVGCSLPEDIHFLYEGHPNFAALPTYFLALIFKGTSNEIVPFTPDNVPLVPSGLGITLTNVFHLSQDLRVYKPLSCSGGEFTCTTNIQKAFPMGKKGVGIVTQTAYFTATGDKVAESNSTAYIKGLREADLQGMKLSTANQTSKADHPQNIALDDSPCVVQTYKTSRQQAAIYRLSGDYNPMHISTEAAHQAGLLQGPLLHGLCTFGIAARALCQNFCPGRPDRLIFIQASFSKPVYPGDVLHIRMKKVRRSNSNQDNGVLVLRIAFDAIVWQKEKINSDMGENSNVVLKDGMAEILADDEKYLETKPALHSKL
mmetsp:Transcript_18085/g.23798  ORF Transcript_18085/g.23798 Transcript_18085/m.23798 type:complete len:348 (+) Transcript_18085:65-1108(+)